MYEIKGNLRFVKEYTHVFTVFAKKRWLGRKLVEVFTSELKAYSGDYYKEAIETSRITVNDKTVSLEYRIKEQDKIVHKAIRNETPCLSTVPQVLFENDSLVAFEKPSSMPVHACGNFQYNSLLKICEDEMKYSVLKIVHRLDRQTSGIVFFAKDEAASNVFREAMVGKGV